MRNASSSLASAACIVVSNWLSWACSAASFTSTFAADVLDVVRHVGLQQQQRGRAVVGEAVLREEVRIAGGDDRVAHEPPGVAVVGVQAVPLPRVVAEHDVRPQRADRARSRSGRPIVLRSPSTRPRNSPRRPARRQTGGPPRAARPGAGRPAPAGSASTSHVPFDPSVQTRWWTRSRRPPTWRACRRRRTRRRRGGRRSPAPTRARRGRRVSRRRRRCQRRLARIVRNHGGSSSSHRVTQVGGVVDVERQERDRAHLDPAAGRRSPCARWRPERAGAVARVSAAPDGQGHHVRAVAAPVGHDRDGVAERQPRQVGGERQVAVGDDDVVEALAGDRLAAGVDRTVEAQPRAPQHFGAGRVRPLGDVSLSHATYIGQRPPAATTRPASQRARSTRSRRRAACDRRPLAWSNRFTGTSTATWSRGTCTTGTGSIYGRDPGRRSSARWRRRV